MAPSTTSAILVLSTTLVTIVEAMPPPPPPDHGPHHDDGGGPSHHGGECRLMGPFALFVQLALGGLALLSLVFKRLRERPQRPVKVWFFDASKQVFGSVLVHVANVFMSILTSGRLDIKAEPDVVGRLLARSHNTPNPCSFYLLNLGIDTTIGIPILIVLLRIFTALVARTPLGSPPESIQSGFYGHPPRKSWWLKQSLIYFCGLFGMKLVVLFIFIVLPWISRVGDWALRWTEGDERLQIIFVMMLFPVIMNAIQYYIIDSFIKKQAGPPGGAEHQPLAGEDPDDERDERVRARRPSSSSDDSQTLLSPEDDVNDGLASDDERTVKMHRSRFSREASGCSGRSGGKLISPELLPTE
jgi:hypothetical protein